MASSLPTYGPTDIIAARSGRCASCAEYVSANEHPTLRQSTLSKNVTIYVFEQ